MNSYKIVQSHIWIYKHFGLWPPNKPSCLYSIFTAFAIGFIYLGFPIQILSSILFVTSVNQAVDNLVITSSLLMAGIKGVNVFLNRKKLKQLFEMLAKLDNDIKTKDEEEMFRDIFNDCRNLLKIFLFSYLSAWSCLALQIYWSNTDQILWSSTLMYPIEAFKARPIYLGVWCYQCFSNFCICVIDASADTYGVVLNHILGGHIEVLGKRLRHLGHSGKSKNSDVESTAALIECVKTYTLCLRYEHISNYFSFLMNKILSK